jgi:hypothetical protein
MKSPQIINHIAKTFFCFNQKNVEKMMLHPLDCQQQCFYYLLNTAKNTEWGKTYDYHTVKQYDTFQDRVPISDYNSLYPYIERMIMGEKDVLWKGKTTWFSKSSGTTGSKSKYIPVSRESLFTCNYKGGKDSVTLYLNNRPDSKMFAGKYMSLSGSWRSFDTNSQAYCGDVSAILLHFLPQWARHFRTPPADIALMSNWNEKVESYAQHIRKQNVTSLAGVPSWILMIIRRILELEQAENLSAVWQNLELFMHGGVNFTPYINQYKSLIPNEKMYYQQIYNASEGYFAAQDRENAHDMLLLVDNGVFYEFIPLREFGTESQTVIPLSEVKTGVNYVMIISTNAGLWRYVIGDVVQFTSCNPYRIIISGRTTHFINAFGEELMVDNAENALRAACEKTDAIVAEYTAAPVYLESDAKAAHEWLIEFKQPPSSLDLFTQTLDNELMKLNSDYEAKRSNDILLQRPLVQSIPQGTFLKWLSLREKLGGQFKVTRLANDRKIIEEIKSVVND